MARLNTQAAPAAPGARLPSGRGLVLLLAGLYFLVPVAATLWFTVDDGTGGVDLGAYTEGLVSPALGRSLLLSVGLGLCTVLLTLLLLVPAVVVVSLHLPRLRGIVQLLCMTPLVVPPIALVAGVSTVLSWAPMLADTYFFQTFMVLQNQDFPLILVFVYTVMSLPFMYRALDAGIRGVDLRTLVESSRSLGAGRLATLARVVVPNLRSALISGSVLSLAMVLGEYTVASVLGFSTFPVWMVEANDSGDGQLSGAAAMLSLLFTWGLLLLLTALAGARTSRRSRTRNRRNPA
ncbi:ABC transporter permease subunit [Streptomyces sp. HNM0574]|uniref:ABC transporter permease n=1 Tax=Streptomyces sp. HNM0574 TaxID=2714954 RepID=UPI00146CCC91|nr:ABC transporter permease subunit [Streptomyces sp. HNM0574]NLU67354.1 ABC transporter permease subunit [Streptomyces sp. HNM0574]